MGAELREFPQRPGVGVAKVLPGSNTELLNEQVLSGEVSGMWVLEGDEVIAVNGTACGGEDLDTVVGLVAGSDGATVTLTLARNYLKSPKGPVKVIFLSSGNTACARRGDVLSEVAALAGEGVPYSCREGWCGTCWHKEESTGETFKPCKDEVPRMWDNVMPLALTPAPQKNSKD